MGYRKVFTTEEAQIPFHNEEEFTEYLFMCVNIKLSSYIEDLKKRYALGNGEFKNVLYPDIQIAATQCQKQITDFIYSSDDEEENEPEIELDDELNDLLLAFSEETNQSSDSIPAGENSFKEEEATIEYIIQRAELSLAQGINLRFYSLCKKQNFTPLAYFCMAAGILAATQTSYASIFQVVNQNGGLSIPTIESASKVYFGRQFSVTGSFGAMSDCLENLLPLLNLNVDKNMPFSTTIHLDKRLIDYLYGTKPDSLDENYDRFFTLITGQEELDPVMANEEQLEALNIAYDEGSTIFSLWGDEGSGRKFFIKHFCRVHEKKAISINCRKLFVYDFAFVEKAIWAVTRECILGNACCSLDELVYHGDQEKDRFFGYLDLAFARLSKRGILVFTVSEEKLALREATTLDYAQLELPIPSNYQRVELWKYYSAGYSLNPEIDMEEMATKFLFTAGKIKKSLHQGRNLSTMQKFIQIERKCLFEACYNQMKHELTQKATKIKANFSFEDIIMPPDQKETMLHVIEQMTFRKQVYEQWDYNRKYPYGRGLSVLLFGAPGTGKSMCAQVIAHELNLELYRVDLSKVMDKYVGETEKSISMIFREAKKCNVVLFFDECDTMFGKRSDKGGSGEQSANNKTAHLLQEVEAYDGVTVLATNYKHNIDPAFFRRMKFIVEFQFPDPETRYQIWKATIPKNTPLAEDVDIRFLADKFEFVGGNIKNCILNAAFLAAADGDGKEVGMKHYLQAIKYEFVKTGKVFTRADFEPYASMVGLASRN